jgi:adenine phosphoribosyltransferase
LAFMLGKGFIPIRKKGKLPYETVKVEYELEYGTDTLEMHKDAVKPGQRVVIVDDLLATGGTTKANLELIQKLGGQVAGLVFFIELGFLNGREKLKGNKIESIIEF